jgi:hypothetical protein
MYETIRTRHDVYDFRPGNLLAHLPLNILSVVSRNEAAENRSDWISKTFFERISLNMQCP